jgi:hypothetical protein
MFLVLSFMFYKIRKRGWNRFCPEGGEQVGTGGKREVVGKGVGG